MSTREPMSSVDVAWLQMDRPTNPMMIVGVMKFDAPLDYERVRRTIETRMLKYERFRMRPVVETAGAHWEIDPRFSIDRHVMRAKLPGRRGVAELKRFVARLASRPLNPRRPLWDYHLVETCDGGSALVGRIHHCYADGIALMGVLLSMTDDRPDAPPDAATQPAPPAPGEDHEPGAEGLTDLLAPLGDLASGAVKLSGRVLERYVALLRDPSQVAKYAKAAAGVIEAIAEIATMADDSRTRFKGEVGQKKLVAWTEPLPLEQVKAVGRVLGASVNDVLLSCVAGALRRYLVDRGEATAGVELRAMVPVNLRPPGKADRLGNSFGLVPLVLPVGIVNPLRRLYEVHDRMEALKRSYVAPVVLGILGVAGYLPKQVQQHALDLLANKATAVMTNVPGPQQPLYMAGAQLAQIMFWVPQSGSIGMGVSILSYAGGVQFGVITDAGLVPDPEQVVAGFGPEFERLMLTVLMEPWDARRPPELVEKELARALGRRSARTPGARATPRRQRERVRRPRDAAEETPAPVLAD